MLVYGDDDNCQRTKTKMCATKRNRISRTTCNLLVYRQRLHVNALALNFIRVSVWIVAIYQINILSLVVIVINFCVHDSTRTAHGKGRQLNGQRHIDEKFQLIDSSCICCFQSGPPSSVKSWIVNETEMKISHESIHMHSDILSHIPRLGFHSSGHATIAVRCCCGEQVNLRRFAYCSCQWYHLIGRLNVFWSHIQQTQGTYDVRRTVVERSVQIVSLPMAEFTLKRNIFACKCRSRRWPSIEIYCCGSCCCWLLLFWFSVKFSLSQCLASFLLVSSRRLDKSKTKYVRTEKYHTSADSLEMPHEILNSNNNSSSNGNHTQ